jgi:hypothetical protein
VALISFNPETSDRKMLSYAIVFLELKDSSTKKGKANEKDRVRVIRILPLSYKSVSFRVSFEKSQLNLSKL